MRRFISVGAIFLLLGLSYVFTGCSQKASPENFLAEFDKQAITLDEFEKEFSELSDREKRKYEGEEGLAEYLTLMAESRMLLDVARDEGLDRDEEMAQQVQDYKDQLIVKELVKREVDDKVAVNDSDLKQYYEENKADYVEPDKIVVTEITLKDEEKAKELMAKIKDGADFTELAKEVDAKGESEGPGAGNEGKTRPFSESQFRNAQEFVKTAFALELNQISDIIVQPMGEITYYMIIRLDEKIPSRQKEFSEVEKKIRRLVQKQKKKDQMDSWLEKVKAEKKYKLYPDRIPESAIEAATTEKTKATTEETKATTAKEEEKKSDEATEEKK